MPIMTALTWLRASRTWVVGLSVGTWLMAACATGSAPASSTVLDGRKERGGQTPSPSSVEPDVLEDGTGQPLVLWSVERDGVLRGFLHGSVHLLPGAHVGERPRIEAAYAQSEVLVVEVDVAVADPSVQLLTMQLGMYPEGDSLAEHVSEALLERVLAEVDQHKLPRAAALRMRPWLLAVTFTMLGVSEEGFSPEYGIDRRFLAQAHGQATAKPVVALETADAQLRMFAELSDEEQQLFLEDALLRSDTRENMKIILDAWVAGDVQQLAERLFAPLREDPDLRPLYETFYFRRNRAMAERLLGMFESGKTHFVVVGAAHLVGEDSLPRLLLQRGYEVRRLRAAPAPDAATAVPAAGG